MDPNPTTDQNPDPAPAGPRRIIVTSRPDPNPQVIAHLHVPGRPGEIEVWWANRASMTGQVEEEFVDLGPHGRPGVHLLVIAHDVLAAAVDRALATGADVDAAVLDHVIARGAHYAAVHLAEPAA